MPYREVAEGVHIYFDDEGSGRPLVLLHGLWASGRSYARLVDRLRERYRVVVPDLRAHGRSSHVQHGHTVATYACDVRRLVESLGLTGPILMGSSLGAQVCWEYVRHFGAGSVAGLIVIGQPATPRRSDRAALLRRVKDLQTQRSALIEEMVPSPELREDALRIPVSIAAAILLDHGLKDFRLDLERAEVPTLVLCGRHDRRTPIAVLRRLIGGAPAARLQIFEQSGPSPFDDEPEAFDRAIHEFITELPGSRIIHLQPRRSP